MMLMLYDHRQTDFTTNGDPINGAYAAHVTREEGFYLKFKLALDEEGNYKKIQPEMIIGAMTPDGLNQFRVFDILPKKDHVEVIALQLFYYLDKRLVKPFSLTRADGGGAIKAFESNFVSSIAPYTFDSGVSEVHDFTTDTSRSVQEGYYNALEIINRIATRWDSEFLLNGFDVRMVKRLGKRTNALLYERKNISDFESEDSIRKLVTRIYAKSQWTLDPDDKDYVKDAKGKENEREIKVTVDSPLIDQYSQIYEAEYTNNNCKTEQELINWAKLKYSTDHLDKPARSIEVKTNIIDDTVINFGDELVLKYTIHDIDETIRCVGYDYDPINEQYYSVTLGDWRQSFGKAIGGSIADVSERQKSELERLKTEVQIVQMRANGINRVTYGPQPVPNPINGDLWFKHTLDRPDEVTMWVYDAEIGDWVRKDITPEEIRLKLKALETQATEANQKAEQIQSESAKKLAEFEQQLKDLGLPTESIEQTLDQLRQQLDRVSSRTNATLDMIGNDGVTRYNKNLLKGEFKRTIDYDDGKTSIVANDGGFKKGQTYTISFDAVCKLIQKGKLTISLSPPNALRPVNITVKPPKKRLDDIVVNTVKKENTIETYQGLNKVIVQNGWYETREFDLNVGETNALNFRLKYRDYIEDDLKTDRQFVWNNNHELLIESSL
ncbi:phage tail spike protein [Facklamia hominis]|uniref:phage tail spike protein n=1 Tax=Facklamia hominis TaxID=178214 RepID=UPI0029D40FAA|nr:phage tail spike protein [Facklamia hominis]WPJ91085.1 phage tail spike protein [Facklamia hominis]